MFIGELRSRGRAVPDDLFLDFEADMIVNTIPPDASMFTAVKALVKMFLRGRALDRELAGGVTVTRAQDLRGPRGQAPYLVPPERSLPLADVILDPGAEAVLRPLGDEPVVSLERVSPGGAGPVVVYVGDQRVGTVGPRDGPRYGPALEAAQRAGRTLMVHGVFSQAQDGVARLQVYPAGIL